MLAHTSNALSAARSSRHTIAGIGTKKLSAIPDVFGLALQKAGTHGKTKSLQLRETRAVSAAS